PAAESRAVLCAEGSRDPEYETGQDRYAQREAKHVGIPRRAQRARVVIDEERRERLPAPRRDQQPYRAASKRQQQALGEKLPNQAGTAGAERHADGDFAP